MRHKLALTVALAILMATVAGGSMAGAESTAKLRHRRRRLGAAHDAAEPDSPVVVPGTPIGGGTVQAAPPSPGAINASPR